jgi:hypothetical protein
VRTIAPPIPHPATSGVPEETASQREPKQFFPDHGAISFVSRKNIQQ